MNKQNKIIYRNQFTQTISVVVVEKTFKTKTAIETTWTNGKSVMKRESIYVEHYSKQRPFTKDIIGDYEKYVIRKIKRIIAGKESLL